MIKKLAKRAISLLPGKLEEVAAEVLDEARKIRINARLIDQVDLNSLAQNILTIDKTNGLSAGDPTEHQQMIQLMFIVTKVAEVAKAYSGREGDDRIEEELAGVIIKALNMAAYWGYDIDKAVRARMEKNKSRGSKRKK